MMQKLDTNYLTKKLLPRHIVIYKQISSTNQYLLEHIKQLSKGTICLAEQQTAGRGRRGRQWHSPLGCQIIMSLYWTLPIQRDIAGLSTVVGLAIADCLQQQGAAIQLKWPNDLLFQQRKLGGILIELAKSNDKNLWHLVIGVGINVCLPTQQQIDQPWANLNEILEQPDRNSLIVVLIKCIEQYLNDFEQYGITPHLQQQWQDFDAYFDQEVKVITEQKEIIGMANGIDLQGRLQLITEDQQCLLFNGGEVSLRKK
ncbi:BirA family biotin operon repressor/biotin-[acetyl-CoA-carboxylase] ligase [Volucribacter psittacicida]|uniref:biotin--[biotin carboxyl-carrier protein] ligase n=1 Tax=Volucribacter psittacicida TaxID=203482 RepID=A0A4R1G7E6_9PAST|nr:bifunctional biotin--[acetyl-CoA-carboxylase] ligase/biotin operon repressor BirA [Volucribacter psittacicida]TCK01549.1 BirA family biotin operon repressor/biotin-[acetyl-CoA-carboxylase] ligase [Volucribacter psittacicida]